MRYQISCIGKLSNIEENKIIQKYIKRVRNKIQIIEFPQSDIKKEGSKLLEYSPKNSILILLDKDGENLSTNKFFDLIKSYEMNNIKILNFLIKLFAILETCLDEFPLAMTMKSAMLLLSFKSIVLISIALSSSRESQVKDKSFFIVIGVLFFFMNEYDLDFF